MMFKKVNINNEDYICKKNIKNMKFFKKNIHK